MRFVTFFNQKNYFLKLMIKKKINQKSIRLTDIKICLYSENSIVDFNQADYCIGNHNIIYLDR